MTVNLTETDQKLLNEISALVREYERRKIAERLRRGREAAKTRRAVVKIGEVKDAI